MNSNENGTVNENKRDAINKLNYYLEELISSNNLEQIKKADLLSYWLKDYIRYLKGEKTFQPNKQENYKRGDVIKVNLGFNIGNEEGGLHYAIVVNNPAKLSGIVTIVPLTSKKTNAKYHSSTVNLGYTIMEKIILKLEETKGQLMRMNEQVKCLEDGDSKRIQQKNIEKTIRELKKYIKEINKLKVVESIALVGNITTISKQRVYTPTLENKFLKGITISSEQLDLIDNKIKELYTKRK